MPLTPDALSLETLFLLNEAVTRVESCRFKVLLTVVPPKPAKDGDEIRQTLLEANFQVFTTVIRRYKVYQKAALAGTLVCNVDDQHATDAWSDYVRVAAELTANLLTNEPTRETTEQI